MQNNIYLNIFTDIKHQLLKKIGGSKNSVLFIYNLPDYIQAISASNRCSVSSNVLTIAAGYDVVVDSLPAGSLLDFDSIVSSICTKTKTKAGLSYTPHLSLVPKVIKKEIPGNSRSYLDPTDSTILIIEN